MSKFQPSFCRLCGIVRCEPRSLNRKLCNQLEMSISYAEFACKSYSQLTLYTCTVLGDARRDSRLVGLISQGNICRGPTIRPVRLLTLNRSWRNSIIEDGWTNLVDCCSGAYNSGNLNRTSPCGFYQVSPRISQDDQRRQTAEPLRCKSLENRSM